MVNLLALFVCSASGLSAHTLSSASAAASARLAVMTHSLLNMS